MSLSSSAQTEARPAQRWPRATTTGSSLWRNEFFESLDRVVVLDEADLRVAFSHDLHYMR